MRAILVEQFGGPEVLRPADANVPEPCAGELRIKLHAAGVNPVETYIRSGNYAAGLPALPYIPGADGAGVVDAIGDDVNAIKSNGDRLTGVSTSSDAPGIPGMPGFPGFAPRLGIGDRVFVAGALSSRVTGTYAEYVVCDAKAVFPLPARMSFEQGAGLGTPGFTACQALFRRARLSPGESVLIHGASGGVGSLAVQLAKRHGAVVYGTAGGDRGLALLKELGAARAFNHNDKNYIADILAATGNRGVDVVIEMLANVNLEKDLSVLAERGRIAIVGNRGVLDFNPRLIMLKDAEILGVMLKNMRQDELTANSHTLIAALDIGVRAVVAAAYPLEQAAAAHTDVIEKSSYGKIVLTI